MGRAKGVLVSDKISDLFTRIRNGQQARRVTILAPYSGLSTSVLSVLIERGYIRSARVLHPDPRPAPQYKQLEIFLKYDEEGEGAIKKIQRVSRPTRRVYSRIDELCRNARGLGCWILSTNQGVLHCGKARELRVGGEVLGEVL